MCSPTRRPNSPLPRAAAFVLALVAGAVAPGLAGCSINAATAKGSLERAVEDARSVAISSENGSVELIQDPDATVMQISATIRCSASTEAEAAARVKATTLVAVREADGMVRIGIDFPPRDPADAFAVVGGIGASNDSASIVIRAASLDGIEVETSNGSIGLGAFRGAARLTTSNGSIEVKGHAGPIEARSSNGAIRASGVAAPIVAKTSNGRIAVELADSAQGDVELDTSNGAVSLELGARWEGTVTADTSNAKIDLSGGEVVRKDGARTMTIGDGTKASARIDTSNGRITVRAARK